MRISLVLSSLLCLSIPALVAADTPVAKVGTTTLTEEALKKDLQVEMYEAEKSLYDMKINWIDEKAKGILFEAAAKERGITKEAWHKTFIEEKISEPTPAEVNEFLQRYPEEMRKDPTNTKKVVDYLKGQRLAQKEDELFTELKKKTPVEVLVTAPPSPYKPVAFAADDPAMGPANAKVTIVEFTDFECPYCQRSQEALHEVEKAYSGKVKIVARQYPLPMHARAKPAAEAALCAHEQGKFWPFREKVFGEKKLEDADFTRFAKEIKLNEKKFASCLSEHRMAARVDKDIKDGESYGVRGTPHFFINGQAYSGAIPFAQFKEAIDTELKKK